jgi:hypothetical protein
MAARMPVGGVANEGQQQRGQSCVEKKSSFISDLHQFWKLRRISCGSWANSRAGAQ